MAMALARVAVLAAMACISLTTAHVCLITPRQRGDMDVSQSGSHTCFRHGDPCGGQEPEEPQWTLYTGEAAFIKWQQNYNHYSVGYPGYMEVSLGNLSATTAAEFTVLAVVGDRYVYNQDYQHNFTAVVTIPDTPCDHCVIRLRYNAHKPGESPFIQCADVRVMTPNPTRGHPSRLLAQVSDQDPGRKSLQQLSPLTGENGVAAGSDVGAGLYGVASDVVGSSATYIHVDPGSGERRQLSSLPFHLDVPDSSITQDHSVSHTPFVLDGVAVLDAGRDVMVLVKNSMGNPDDVSTAMVTVGARNGSVLRTDRVFNYTGPPFSALVLESYQRYLTFAIFETSKPGVYGFEVGRLDWSGLWQQLIRPNMAEDTYVNYQWAQYDAQKQRLYVLMGNENDADGLSAKIFTFDIQRRTFYAWADVLNTQFTFMAMTLYEKTGQLVAVSPGLHNQTYPPYTLVQVDALKGAVWPLCSVAPPGIFEQYYGGTIFNGLDQSTGKLQHVLRVADTAADVIVTIDVYTCKTSYSQLTNVRDVHNLVRVEKPPPATAVPLIGR